MLYISSTMKDNPAINGMSVIRDVEQKNINHWWSEQFSAQGGMIGLLIDWKNKLQII